MNDDEVKDLIREIAAEHGIALDRDDPILILQTATRRILRDALQEAHDHAQETLAQHRSELELAAQKWHGDAKRSASLLMEEVQGVIATTMPRELSQAAVAVTGQLEQAFARHEKAVERSTLTCTVAAAASMLAAGAVLLGYCG